MENLLARMQHSQHGVPIRNVKTFISKIPSVFSGIDLISWMLKNLDADDSQEALHLAQMMTSHGYIFPIDDHILMFKNDSTYYRFQTPCFWPSMHTDPEDTSYAVYLCKRTMLGKQRLELADYEAENMSRLQKTFARQWEFICMQADAQAKLDRKRDKSDRQILDSQERAFWDVHRPAPGCVNTTEVDIKKTCRTTNKSRTTNRPAYNVFGGSISPNIMERQDTPTRTTRDLKEEMEQLKRLLGRSRIKISKVFESYMTYNDQYLEYDPLVTPSETSNPWITDNCEYWDDEATMKDIPQRRVRKWSFSIRELLKDISGRDHFMFFLEKEFSAENLKFWEACQHLHKVPEGKVQETVQQIYEEFLAPGAKDPVNVDCRVSENVRRKMEERVDRFCFDDAEEQIMLLMKNDSYNRYIRSDMYKDFLTSAKKKQSKKRFTNEVRRLRELTTSKSQPNVSNSDNS